MTTAKEFRALSIEWEQAIENILIEVSQLKDAKGLQVYAPVGDVAAECTKMLATAGKHFGVVDQPESDINRYVPRLKGYVEAQKIDDQIMDVYKGSTSEISKRELLKYLRTIETTCILLQQELTA